MESGFATRLVGEVRGSSLTIAPVTPAVALRAMARHTRSPVAGGERAVLY